MPVLSGVQECLQLVGLGSVAAPIQSLFSQRPPPAVSPKGSGVCEAQSIYGDYITTRPASINRNLAIERFDYRSASGRQALMGRFALSRFSQPDFVFSVYPDSNAPLIRDTNGVALNHIWQFRPAG